MALLFGIDFWQFVTGVVQAGMFAASNVLINLGLTFAVCVIQLAAIICLLVLGICV